MRIIRIPKKDGRYRKIFVPEGNEMTMYKSLLSQIPQPAVPLKYAHGFMVGKNIVTNAMNHVGYKISIRIDLKDFFDTVNVDMVKNRLPEVVINNCMLNNLGATYEVMAGDYQRSNKDFAPRQGLPTSPAIANMAAVPMDEAISRFLHKRYNNQFSYSRYADDLIISGNWEHSDAVFIRDNIYGIIRKCGFQPNLTKTRIMHATSGYRRIAGVMVTKGDDDGTLFGEVRISRNMKRKIRSIDYQVRKLENTPQGVPVDKDLLKTLKRKLHGLQEFRKLKTPDISGKKKRKATLFREANEIAKFYGINKPIPVKKLIPEMEIGPNIFVTNDPVYFYGMSEFTTGWTSCMSFIKHPGGYSRGVWLWQHHPGVSLAYVRSENTMTINGVTRNKMIERALVYKLTDGTLCFGDIYNGRGHWVQTDSVLGFALIGAGFIPVSSNKLNRVNMRVAGSVKYSNAKLPYFDNTYIRVVYSNSKKVGYKIFIK